MTARARDATAIRLDSVEVPSLRSLLDRFADAREEVSPARTPAADFKIRRSPPLGRTFDDDLGPLLEASGYVLTGLAALLRFLNWQYFGIMVAVSVLFGTATTLLAVLLNDVVTRRYMRGRDLIQLVAAVPLENCGDRQVNVWWGCVGTVQALRGKGGWGPMQRRAFEA